MCLRHKVTLVTDAGAGIGKTITEPFAGEGSKVVINDINENTARQVANGIQRTGGTALSSNKTPAENKGGPPRLRRSFDEYSHR